MGKSTENSTELIMESNFPHGAIQPAVRTTEACMELYRVCHPRSNADYHGASRRHPQSCMEGRFDYSP